MQHSTTTRRTTVLTRREFDAVTSYCYHSDTTVAASADLRDWIGCLNDTGDRWTAEGIVRAIQSALDHHGDCAGQRPELRRALRKAEQVAAEGAAEVRATVPYCSPAYIIRLCFAAYGYCSSSTLISEVVADTGLDREQARRAVHSFLATDLRVRVDALSNCWFIPGLGGC